MKCSVKTSFTGRSEGEGSGFCFHPISILKTFQWFTEKVVFAEETYWRFAVLQSINIGVANGEDLQKTILF